ncbi:MAG TPA: amidohydrolase family protein [Gammaproteobacteria bacterium]|nr:amidohydrolase family protein [Gammaproteobacteria bacterium]
MTRERPRLPALAIALLLPLSSWAHEGHGHAGLPPWLSQGPAFEQADAVGQPGQTLPMAPGRRIAFDTDQGTWLSPDVSPDGRRIVFELLGDLYTMPAAGGTARAITRGLAFDSQPVFSPDGRRIAFLSDRSGAENLWLVDADGRAPRQLTLLDGNPIFASPAWSADGRALFVSRYRPELEAWELWRFDAAHGDGELLLPIRERYDQPPATWRSALGAAPSADGRFVYYAAHVGPRETGRTPEWTIRRRDLRDGSEETLVSAPRSPRPDLVLGTAMRPAVSPDGRWLVYGARHQARTGLRVLDLQTRADRWLAFPVQQDELGASHWRDLLPRHAFTPDGSALVVNVDGGLQRIALADGTRQAIPFRARVDIELGAATRQSIRQDTGPVRARLIQTPEPSPDGARLAFSALGALYVMPLDGSGTARRIDTGTRPAFHPSWSPDGRELAYIDWTAKDAGHVWRIALDAPGSKPRQVSSTPAFHTRPVFTPDGTRIVAIRSSNSVRMHSYMEYGTLRDGELVVFERDGGDARVVASGRLGGRPHFDGDASRVHVLSGGGLERVALDGSGQDTVLQVTGPGWYFAAGRAPVDDLRISPDGRWALAQIAQQLHLLAMPEDAGGTLDLAAPGVAHAKLTTVGADFFGWSDGGRTLHWAVGSTWYRRPLDGVRTHPADAPSMAVDMPVDGRDGVQAFAAVVEVPRDTPRGALLLRGATALTMRGDEAVVDADLLVVDDRIAAVGKRGSVAVPDGATVLDVSGRYLIPGLIDTHTHIADIRRDVLDLESWGPLANLAYGVTTVFDPSTLSIDTLAYQDLVEAGRMPGARIFSTGPAIFSFNEFTSYEQVRDVLRRHRGHYRLGNIKMYRTGNRRVRQWVAMAARETGLMPTTEGALSMKLGLTHALDGYAGNEHALVAVPLQRDVVRLFADAGTAYSATLMIGNGGPEGQDDFISRGGLAHDRKLRRFAPGFIVDMKTRSRTWREPDEYLYPRVAAGVAEVVRAGGVVGMGSHGEMPGIGLHWEMQAHAMGGMSNAEVLLAATLGGAATIGRDAEFGSLEAGKFADLVVLAKDPRSDLANALSIVQVMKNGRLLDGDTLHERWPTPHPLPRPWHWDDRPPGTPDPGAPVHEATP